MSAALLSAVLVVLAPWQQGSLEAAALRLAEAWSAGDAAALRESMAPGGVRLHLDGREHGLLGPRQAVAALEGFLERRSSANAAVRRVRSLGGEPLRGYAELEWRAVVEGTSEPVTTTVFVEMTRSGERWQITEIRVLARPALPTDRTTQRTDETR